MLLSGTGRDPAAAGGRPSVDVAERTARRSVPTIRTTKAAITPAITSAAATAAIHFALLLLAGAAALCRASRNFSGTSGLPNGSA